MPLLAVRIANAVCALVGGMFYSGVAAAHLFMLRHRVALRPELLVRARREARVESRVPPRIEDECPYAWQAVLWRGIAYADALLDLDRPVLVRVLPPRDKRGRERLRVIVEGKRVTVKGRTYHVGGLLRRLDATRVAPWLYLVPRRRLPELAQQVQAHGGELEIIELRARLRSLCSRATDLQAVGSPCSQVLAGGS